MAKKPEALIIDDERSTVDALAKLVSREGFDVRTAVDLASARSEIEQSVPDVVLCDLVLPDGDGTELLVDFKEHPQVETILVTANATVSSAVEALRLGAYDYLTKPVDVPRLRTILGHLRRGLADAARTWSRCADSCARWGGSESLVGTSQAMQEVFDLIERVAPTDTTVLVVGASGTGKELVAETIHEPQRALRWRSSSRSTAARFRRSSSRASSSATKRAASPAPTAATRACSSGRTGAPCCSMRSPRCRRSCRSSCCGCSRAAP